MKKSCQKNTRYNPNSHNNTRPSQKEKRYNSRFCTIINPSHPRKRTKRIPNSYHGRKEHMPGESQGENIPRKGFCTKMFYCRKTSSNHHTSIEYLTSSDWFKKENGQYKKEEFYYFFCNVVSNQIQCSKKSCIRMIWEKIS